MNATRRVLPGALLIAMLVHLRAVTAMGASPSSHAGARISGVVVTAEPTPVPVRRAIVSLLDESSGAARYAITTDDGTFELRDVPAGRYGVEASRPGFVPIAYGARRPGRPGTPLVVRSDDVVENVRVTLVRGAIITGVVRDASGEPVTGVDVAVRTARTAEGRTDVVATTTTDDQGAYRIFGLQAGSYTVSVRPRSVGSGDVRAPSDAEVDAMLRRLQERRRFGAVTPNPFASVAAPGESGQVGDVVPVYYPGVFAPEEAAPIAVVAGEERAGVDIPVRIWTMAKIRGRVTSTDGRARGNVLVTLVRAFDSSAVAATSAVAADGSFRFSGVTPGQYALVARAMSQDTVRASLGLPSSERRDGPAGECAFAYAELAVTGGDVEAPVLALRPCPRILGRIEFRARGDVKPPGSFSGVRVSLVPERSDRSAASLPIRVPPVIGPDGHFVLGEFGDVVPGRYLLSVELPDSESGRGWWLESASADGRDVLDVPLEIGAETATTTAVFTFTDRRSSLSGTVETAPGAAATDYTVMAFSTNRDWWRPPFRRVRSVRPGTNAEYMIPDLPAGEYYLAVLTDAHPDDLRDAVFLAEIAGMAIRVTVGAAEHKIQNVRIRGSR